MIASKLKEAILCLRTGLVTLKYPFAPHPPEGDFRGYPEVDVDKCIGCGGCAAVCPSRTIMIQDIDQNTRRIVRLLERCIYCGRCADVCPEDAITMTKQFELSTDKVRDDLEVESEVFMATCQRCGQCYEPPSALDKIMQPGFRDDEIKRGGQNSPYEPVKLDEE